MIFLLLRPTWANVLMGNRNITERLRSNSQRRRRSLSKVPLFRAALSLQCLKLTGMSMRLI